MLFGVIDDKGGEKPKDMCKMLMEGDQLKFEHTNRGSKPIDSLLHLFEHDHNEMLHCKLYFKLHMLGWCMLAIEID